MKLDDITDYEYGLRNYDFARLLCVEQTTNSNGSVNTFYNLNDGVTIDGIDSLSSDDVEIYTCKNGDDLRFISYDLYGTTEYWWLIAKINGMEDCMETLSAGQKLKYLPKHYMNYIFDKIKDSSSNE